VLISKQRAWLLGLLAPMLVGSYTAASAYAVGPFFHQRAIGGKGNGVKIAAGEPEVVSGSAGKQELRFEVGEQDFLVTSPRAELKGVIYNNALQGQAKLSLTFVEPKIEEPALSGCTATIGANNTIKLLGHQAWTWNGTEAQLEEQSQKEQKPEWIFLPQELQQGAEGLPKEQLFFYISLGPKGSCGALSGKLPVVGSLAVAVEPSGVEEWSTSETGIFLPNPTKLHFWNGVRNVGVEAGATQGTGPFTLTGKYQLKTAGRQGGASREVARFES
jgi:hypothetical protein